MAEDRAAADRRGLSPDELRALADRIESASCTGLAAAWCPIHGDCTCPDRSEAMDSPTCPLHSLESSHAAKEVERVVL